MTLSLRQALLGLTAAALLAGTVPAGIALQRQLAQEIKARARDELALAPRLLADRNQAVAEGLRMHAKELARAPDLATALSAANRGAALQELDDVRGSYGDRSILITRDGQVWAGPTPSTGLVERTLHGETPVAFVSERDSLHYVALAPVEHDGAAIGVAGVAMSVGKGLAGTLAALTRAEVVILNARGRIVATTDTTAAAAIANTMARRPMDDRLREARLGARRYLVARSPLGNVATVVFVRDLDRELAVVPKLRQVIILSDLAMFGLSLAFGALLTVLLARPVRSLAAAADRLAAGDFAAPLDRSSIREVSRLAEAFDGMRRSLAARLEELTTANHELEDRQARLSALESELLQRERLAASDRLLTELAHEIRNPVASVRNCLEVLRRRLEGDPEGREFANIAIDELLRMHELAEQMLDLNRPRDPAVSHCEVAAVAREVAALVRLGAPQKELTLTIEGEAEAAIAPDGLRQVLLNLIQNSREAMPRGLEIRISVSRESAVVSVDVMDNGPGIPAELLPRVFDPFFTTKGSVYGVGLGLFIAEGLVRRYGGLIRVGNAEGRRGAWFHIELVPAEAGTPPTGSRRGEASAGPEESA